MVNLSEFKMQLPQNCSAFNQAQKLLQKWFVTFFWDWDFEFNLKFVLVQK